MIITTLFISKSFSAFDTEMETYLYESILTIKRVLHFVKENTTNVNNYTLLIRSNYRHTYYVNCFRYFKRSLFHFQELAV